MEWSKIKNIILIILLLVNGLLLVQTARQEIASARYDRQARTGAVEVLRRAGIEVVQLPRESGLTALTTERDRDSEAALAEALLGGARKTDDGGRVAYAGDRGEGWFRSDGSFSFTFYDGAYATGTRAEAAHGAELMAGAGYDCTVTGEVHSGSDARITVQQRWQEAPVFTCKAVLTYRDGTLTAVEGQRLIGTPMQSGAGETTLDVATVLLRFLSGMRDGGYVCTRIEGLTAGYQTTAALGGVSKLSPVWQVETDAGRFLVDGTTGALTMSR